MNDKNKKNEKRLEEQDKSLKIEVTEESFNVTDEDERPGIGWEITGNGSSGG
ncbi:hypothetical protein JYG23_11720 [Sedimentibacter sp. zth1]|uniref:hypothetical protein n=1 Tax=Sedimentibacter sp. zth1 TaxID=2816908 RepID=UPI001A91CE38|nr:hypothetical protein [Sedimentibacter sp. zth1]QSX05338.1 hypothetical protein JYG23_11720 [Sedimentibacter sp. zth1]